MAHVITVLGIGRIGRGKAVTAVEDLVDSIPHEEGAEPRFLFPVLDKISPVQQYIAEWALDLSYKFDWLLGPGAEASISEALLDAAQEIIDSDLHAFRADIVDEIKGDGRILLAWDDEEADSNEVLIRVATDAGIKTYDLVAGLEELLLDDETDPEDDPKNWGPPQYVTGSKGDEEDEGFAGFETDLEEHIGYGIMRVGKEVNKILDEAQAQIHRLLREYANEQISLLAETESKRARKAVAKEHAEA